MAVRVKVCLRFQGKQAEGIALANSGYETPTPELIIPQRLAKGHWKDALKKATIETYISLFGSGRLRSIGVGKIKVITGTKQSKDVQAKIIVSKHEKELVLNDKLISALGIRAY